MNFNGLRVRTRLALGFGLLAALVVLVALLSWTALKTEHDAFEGFVTQDTVRVKLANEVLNAANARAIGARNLMLATAPEQRDAEKAAVGAAHERLKSRLAELEQAVQTTPGVGPRERELLARFQAVEASYGPLSQAVVAMALQDGQHDAAVARMNAECRPLMAALVRAADDYIAHAEAMGQQHVQRAASDYAADRIKLLAACVTAVLAALGLSTLIALGITRALGAEPAQLGAAAERVAQGDLSPVPGAATAPAGSVLASLGHMQASLSRVVSQVRTASASIATGSVQIASGNGDLSQRTEEQASNLQQTAASMEQMNAAVRNSADTAHQASQLATAASAVAARGGQVMGDVVQTMHEISASSRRIADIIGVIDGIAFQTNILALNAAVEAARAGEQGRGFAVVAAEVRSLAQRSAEAAREIKGLIGASVDKVEAGSRLVSDAGMTMNDIVAQVKHVSELISDISGATVAQTEGIGQVSDAVSQLDQVTQQNAALVEQSAAAADSLQQQAARLADLVDTFKLDPRQTLAAA